MNKMKNLKLDFCLQHRRFDCESLIGTFGGTLQMSHLDFITFEKALRHSGRDWRLHTYV